MLSRAVLLDMDGVIVDSELQWERVSRPWFREAVPGWTDADFRRIVGLGVEDLYRFLVKEFGFAVPERQAMETWETLARRVYLEKVSLSEGLPQALDGLADDGVPVGLVSSSPHRWISLVLDRFGLRPRLKTIVSADDVGGRGKPEPGIYLLAAEKIGVKPDRAVAIEDSRHGVASAKAAGMRVVGFRGPHNREQDLGAADAEIDSFLRLGGREGRTTLLDGGS